MTFIWHPVCVAYSRLFYWTKHLHLTFSFSGPDVVECHRCGSILLSKMCFAKVTWTISPTFVSDRSVRPTKETGMAAATVTPPCSGPSSGDSDTRRAREAPPKRLKLKTVRGWFPFSLHCNKSSIINCQRNYFKDMLVFHPGTPGSISKVPQKTSDENY